MDVGAVELFDHLGGAGAGFDGLKDAEGDEDAATFFVQAVRIDDKGTCARALERWKGLTRSSQTSFQRPT